MRYFLIGSKKDMNRFLGKNTPQDSYEIGEVLAVIVSKMPHKAEAEDLIGVSIVSEEKFVRFLESNKTEMKDEEKEKPLPAE